MTWKINRRHGFTANTHKNGGKWPLIGCLYPSSGRLQKLLHLKHRGTKKMTTFNDIQKMEKVSA